MRSSRSMASVAASVDDWWSSMTPASWSPSRWMSALTLASPGATFDGQLVGLAERAVGEQSFGTVEHERVVRHRRRGDRARRRQCRRRRRWS